MRAWCKHKIMVMCWVKQASGVREREALTYHERAHVHAQHLLAARSQRQRAGCVHQSALHRRSAAVRSGASHRCI